MDKLRNLWGRLVGLFEGTDAPDEPVYEPAQVAAVIVGCLAGMGVLYWLLWSLLVCEGGLFTKIGPVLRVAFTSKTLKDFGYEGYPYKLGLFEGWIVNLAALLLTVALVAGIWFVFQPLKNEKKGRLS